MQFQFCHIYPVIIDTFEEFKIIHCILLKDESLFDGRFLRYNTTSLGFISPVLNIVTTCPACPQVIA